MAYTMYLDGVAMPITPSKVEIKISNQNKTLNLIDGAEINILKEPGLSKVSFELLLPNVSYPFAKGAQRADYYLSLFERLKTGKKSFQWILSRSMPKGKRLFDTNLTVGLEDYNIVEDAKKGLDVSVDVNLKQWRPYGTKTATVEPPAEPSQPPTVTVEQEREASTAPAAKTYTVKKGDSLWAIAAKYYGKGSDYSKIAGANTDKISNPNLIYPGQVLTLP